MAKRWVMITVEETDSREGCDSYIDWEDCAFQEPEDIKAKAGAIWDENNADEPKDGPLWTMWLHWVGACMGFDQEAKSSDLEVMAYVLSGHKANKAAWLSEEAE